MGLIQKAYDWVGEVLRVADNSYARWFLPATYSGRVVTPESSLQTIAVLRCATLIAGAGASLPIDVFQKKGQARIPLSGHPVERLLDSAPNEEMSSMDFRAAMWMSFILWGNAYARIVWDGKGDQRRPIALWFLPPDRVQVKRKEGGGLVYLYQPPGAAAAAPYDASDVLHVRWFSLDGIVGLSAIAQARQAIARNQDAEEYGARFFVNGAKLSLAIEVPNKLSDVAIKNLRESFERQYGGVENAHRIAVLEQGSTVKTMSVNPADAQFLEQEQYSDERIAMLLGVPPHMVGLVSKTTSWGTGIAEQKLGFQAFTMQPLLTFWEKSFERCLLRPDEHGTYIKHNMNAFLRADIKTRFDAYAVAVDKGIFNRNEVRGLEDMDPYTNGGDTYTIQSQMIPVEMAGKITQPSKGPIEGGTSQ